MTATATVNVRKDIIQNLGLRNPHQVVTSFDRTNISLDVRKQSGNVHHDIKERVEEKLFNLIGSIVKVVQILSFTFNTFYYFKCASAYAYFDSGNHLAYIRI